MKNDELDELLDSALSTYADKGPWPGLEERVLRRAQAKRRPWLRWLAIAVPAAAAVLVTIWPKAESPAIPPIPVANTPTPVVAQIEPPAVPKVRARVTRPVASRAPKRPQFPTPTPLTKDERALLSLALQAPEVLQFRDRSIEIEPMQITPLDGGQSEEMKR